MNSKELWFSDGKITAIDRREDQCVSIPVKELDGENIRAMIAELSKYAWIDVKDKLPEYGKYVQCLLAEQNGDKSVLEMASMSRHHSGEAFFYHSENCEYGTKTYPMVIGWQPAASEEFR